MNLAGKVTGLWIYPVKSCRGISLQEMHLGPTGPKHDREFMFVDQNNQFLTLRTEPQLSKIKTSIQGPFLHLFLESDYKTNKIQIELNQIDEQVETIQVWNDSFLAGIASQDINEALSDFLNKSVKLVRYQKQSFRDLSTYATDVVKETMFADGHPVLLTNESSLLDLNEKLKAQNKPVSMMERFRANIIISGLEAFAEDQIQEIQIGETKLAHPKLCARCPVVTQDVNSGLVVSKETLQTLAQYRQVGSKPGVMFGLNLTPSKLGVIRLNDPVVVLK